MDLAIAVVTTDRVTMECKLDEAVTIVRNRAMQEGCRGIVVTRHNFGLFTVALSEDVPFGLLTPTENRARNAN